MKKILFLTKLSEKITVWQSNKSNTKDISLKNSNLEQVKGTKIENQTIINNYHIQKKTKKGNFKKFKNNIKDKKIVILDTENNFPEQELLIKYGFRNIKIFNSLEDLKKETNIGAIIYRYRIIKYFEQKGTDKLVKTIFDLAKFKKEIKTTEKYKASIDLNQLIDYVGKLNVPLFVYSYPERVYGEDWDILTSYYFIVFANFPLMLVNHLKNILIVIEKTK